MKAALRLGEDLRDVIAQKATRLFADKGYSGTSVQEIAFASQCTKPAVYYHFHSKEGLFKTIVEEHLKVCTLTIGMTRTGPGTARERICKSLDVFFDWSHKNTDAMRLLSRLRNRPEADAPSMGISEMHSKHTGMLADAIRRGQTDGEIRFGVDCVEIATVIVGALHYRFEDFLANGQWDRRVLQRAVDIIFDGVSSL